MRQWAGSLQGVDCGGSREQAGNSSQWNTRSLSTLRGSELDQNPRESVEVSLTIGPSHTSSLIETRYTVIWDPHPPRLLCRTRGHLMPWFLEGQSQKKNGFNKMVLQEAPLL